jgi:hypothetical protein
MVDTREIFAGLSSAWKRRMQEVEGRGPFREVDLRPPSPPQLPQSLSQNQQKDRTMLAFADWGSKDPPPENVDHLLYDEGADWEDESWVRAKFFSHQKSGNSLRNSATTHASPLNSATGGAGNTATTQESEQLPSLNKQTSTNQSQQQIGTTPVSKEPRDRPEGEVDKLTAKRNTDAVLSCPCCFTTLCYDCQRHIIYKTQFRAMFVTEACHVVRDRDVRRYKPKNKKNKRKAQNRKNETNLEEEVFFSVCCNVCETEVGVMEEKDEVYHFFNVIPGC